MICIVSAGLGNIASIKNMLAKAGAREVDVVADTAGIRRARKILLPGVGAFDAGRAALSNNGLDEAILDAASRGIFILGICLGMQLLFESSEEGSSRGLGLIRGQVKKFKFSDPSLKIPHIGWNVVKPVRESSLFSISSEENRFYHVHSYHANCQNPEDIAATSNYGYDFPSAVQRENVMGVQFHPEKSHRFGVNLLQRFIELN